MTYPSTMVQNPSLTSSSPLAIPVKKGEKIFRRSLYSVRGSIGSDLETLVISLFGFIFYFYNYCFYCFLFKTSVQFDLKCFNLYSVCLCLSLCFCSIFFVLLDIANMFWVLHTCALSRIIPRCIYFVYFALIMWLDMQVIISDCYFLHVWMNIYLLYVHWSHSLMTTLVWSRYAYMFYSVYKLDRILLAHVRTVYSTCHKRNESFFYVQVFQVTGIYMQVLHSF